MNNACLRGIKVFPLVFFFIYFKFCYSTVSPSLTSCYPQQASCNTHSVFRPTSQQDQTDSGEPQSSGLGQRASPLVLSSGSRRGPVNPRRPNMRLLWSGHLVEEKPQTLDMNWGKYWPCMLVFTWEVIVQLPRPLCLFVIERSGLRFMGGLLSHCYLIFITYR